MTSVSKFAACVAWMAIGTLHFANAQSFEPAGQHAVVLGMDSNQVYLAVRLTASRCTNLSVNVGRCTQHLEQGVRWWP